MGPGLEPPQCLLPCCYALHRLLSSPTTMAANFNLTDGGWAKDRDHALFLLCASRRHGARKGGMAYAWAPSIPFSFLARGLHQCLSFGLVSCR